MGVALGEISSAYHPACPPDPNDTKVEFAIERFVASGQTGSALVQCVSFNKALLGGVAALKLSVSVHCTPATNCLVVATLRNAASNAMIANLTANVVRANTSQARKVWYAVTDFDQADTKRYSATFEVPSED